MRRLSVILTSLLFGLMCLAACEFPGTQQNTIETKGSGNSGTIAILSVNDMHSAIDMMPKFAALADSLRQVYPDLLVFSAGDNRTGNPVNDQYEPANGPMITLMNKVGFDLCAVGNHEWDGGLDALRQNINDADFPFLCANAIIPEKLSLDVKPYQILDVNGIKVAVIGLLETRADGYPGAHPMYFKEIRFKKGMDVLPDYAFLRKQNDVLLLLSHLGFEEDIDVAERHPEFDAIIGGHTHTLVDYPKKYNGVMVTQAGSNMKYATLTLIEVRQGKVVEVKAETLSVQHCRGKNREVQAMVDTYNNDERFNKTLTKAVTPFENREELGCLFTDAIRDLSGADFAFCNTGGLRSNNLAKGPITVKDVYSIDPFNNDVVVYAMTGKQLERFIMESFKKNGRTPSYVSGMSYTVRTASDGYPKSVDIRPLGGRYSKDQVYKVAMNSYMASTVRFESVDEGASQFMTTEEMVVSYLKKHNNVSYKGEKRIFVDSK